MSSEDDDNNDDDDDDDDDGLAVLFPLTCMFERSSHSTLLSAFSF